MYGEGISKVGEILDLGVEFDIVKNLVLGSAMVTLKLGQGRDAVKELLKDNPELLEELAEKIKVAIKEKNNFFRYRTSASFARYGFIFDHQ